MVKAMKNLNRKYLRYFASSFDDNEDTTSRRSVFALQTAAADTGTLAWI